MVIVFINCRNTTRLNYMAGFREIVSEKHGG